MQARAEETNWSDLRYRSTDQYSIGRLDVPNIYSEVSCLREAGPTWKAPY